MVMQWTVGYMNFWIQVSSGYITSSGTAGSYGSFIPHFLMSLRTVLHSGCFSLHFHQQCKMVPFSPYPLQHLLFQDFLTVAILTSRRRYFIVVLTCISLMMSDAEHLFYVFISHLYVSLEKEITTLSSVLTWRIPGTGKPGGLLSTGSHRVGHNWSDLAAAAACLLCRNVCLDV